MTTNQIFNLLSEAWDMGMRGYYAFGGEPMVRKDIVDIIEYAHDLGMITVLNTNGSNVEKKAKELGRCVNFAYISIDAPDEQHDIIRGRKGSFREATKAVEALSKNGSRVTIVSVISQLNLHRMRELAEFAENLGVGIEFNTVDPSPTDPYGRKKLSGDEIYSLVKEQLQYFYEEYLRLRLEGFPLMQPPKVMEEFVEKKPWKCHFPKIFCYVQADGMFTPCTYNYSSLEPINFLRHSMSDFFNSKEYQEHVKLVERCNECLRPCVRLYSYAYEFYNPVKVRSLIPTIKQWKAGNRQGLLEGMFKP